jgi:transcriptional regulator with PAS, ATPase and Fis domain
MSASLQAIKQRFGIIGTSKLLDAALDTAVRIAPTELSVLIQGESGVGKEVFSKIIHALSARKHNPFIAINCGAIPEGTINSELFGHEKGSFTGAVGDRKGYFETVNGGTIFLDEIGEMPLDTQAMLLRILENGEFVRVGSSKVEKTDARIVAATNVNLDSAVQKGRFREDLFYRLSTVPIKVPSLKERPDDIYMLFRKFAVDFAERYRMQPIQLDDRAELILERYGWPGNIRELKNVAEQLSALSIERTIKSEDLLERMPHLLTRNLPSAAHRNNLNDNGLDERDIMYKFLIDMKNDLNQLKSWIGDLVKSNNLTVPNTLNLNQLGLPSGNYPPSVKNGLNTNLGTGTSNGFRDNDDFYLDAEEETDESVFEPSPISNPMFNNPNQPILIQKPASNGYHNAVEVVDENLNMMEHEKGLIVKALKKHNNRRKEASDDLGISERTLYRKIKEYGLD